MTALLTLAVCVTMSPTPIPAKYAPFDKIVLTAPSEGDLYIWQIVGLPDVQGRTPRPPHKQVFDNGVTCCVWAGPGAYIVTVTTIKVDWDGKRAESAEDQWLFDVTSDQPAPGPGPGPSPVDPDAQSVLSWLRAVPASAYTKDKALAIASNYESVAAQAAATPANWSRDTLVAAVKQLNINTLGTDGVAAWRDAFFQPLAVWQSQKGLQANDVAGHVALWQKTATLIRSVAF